MQLYKGFQVEIIPDDSYNSYREPWEEENGHGPVSEWTTRPKRPSERVLCSDRSSHRYYDFGAAVRIAKRDGWSTEKARAAGLPKGSQAVAAVEEDFRRLQRFCEGDWYYVGVQVTDTETGLSASLWGIESDSDEYLEEVAEELSEEIRHQIEARTFPVSTMGV